MIVAAQRRRPTWLLAMLGLTVTVFLAACSSVGGSSTPTPAGPQSAAPPVTVAPTRTECPTSQPAPLPAGETRTVTIETDLGAIAIKIEADLSPIAAGNFVALAGCAAYDGATFYRTATLQDGTPFVIQGGPPSGPGYTIVDEPVTTPYKRGTVAMARTADPNSVGAQFFIVLDDRDADVLSYYNTYQIIGSVTSGMDAVDAIYTASGGQEQPASPIAMTRVTVSTP
jgi:cyclophilin family peptidyl-prolyl cis-trans isomerase